MLQWSKTVDEPPYLLAWQNSNIAGILFLFIFYFQPHRVAFYDEAALCISHISSAAGGRGKSKSFNCISSFSRCHKILGYKCGKREVATCRLLLALREYFALDLKQICRTLR